MLSPFQKSRKSDNPKLSATDKTLSSRSMARWGEDNQTRQQPRKSCQNRSV
ncbi:unknown protein [Microcystis aeruginosa NIES-843]|uniref:Uncharacterized protein n=1 Tax=Microcystis aeruginosa (strain NIES-843 / IAM M-2473) TaxID=449447 RepID=B0JHD2_MICAN|nr:unknown protein [Microcystis aeruginosa NIES-843]